MRFDSTAGFSTQGMCPAPSITAKCAPGMRSAVPLTTSAGVEPLGEQAGEHEARREEHEADSPERARLAGATEHGDRCEDPRRGCKIAEGRSSEAEDEAPPREAHDLEWQGPQVHAGRLGFAQDDRRLDAERATDR